MKEPFRARREALAEAVDHKQWCHVTRTTEDPELGAQWLNTFEGAGLDGVIAKRIDGPYLPGKREMVKVKHARDADCVAIGYRIHKSGEGVGSILLGLYRDDGELQMVGGAASFTAKDRVKLLGDLEPLREGDEPVDGEPSRWNSAADKRWIPVRPEKVCEVAYDQMEGNTVHGRRFRHAVKFRRWRPDREPSSCTFDQLDVPVTTTSTTYWSPEMASKAEEIDVEGVAVRLTNRDKPYFPKLGSKGTKGALFDYYLSVADRMVKLLRDRPVHLQRFPDGIEGEEIYQKRVPQKHPDYLETCLITFPSGRTADALKVTHPSAIAWAAQMGTVTLHPWQVRCPDTEHPDELRIDFDPQPGTGFVEARTIAVDVLKPLLDELGMVGYPKTSGGRGVHVFVRIAATGTSSRSVGQVLRWPARSNGAHPTPSPRRGGRRSAASGCSSTTTRTHATAPSRRRTRRARHRSPRCRRRCRGRTGRRRPRRLHHRDRARFPGRPRRPVGRHRRERAVDRTVARDGQGR